MNLNRRPFRLAAFTLSLLSLPVLRLAALDCNGNGVEDAMDIAALTSEDCSETAAAASCARR